MCQSGCVALSLLLFFFLMIRRPPRSTLFPTRRSSDLNVFVIIGRLRPTCESNFGCAGVESTMRGSRWKHDRLAFIDRKSTRLNSSHSQISYAVFCLNKKQAVHHALPLLPITAAHMYIR